MADEFMGSIYKRKHERKDYNAEVYFSLDAKAYPALVQNISRGGASIKNEGVAKVEEGQEIIINIPFQNATKTVKRKARIVWVTDTHFGIEFV
jgi:hypothetical protein